MVLSNECIDAVDVAVAIIMTPWQLKAPVRAAEEYSERNNSVKCLERKESACWHPGYQPHHTNEIYKNAYFNFCTQEFIQIIQHDDGGLVPPSLVKPISKKVFRSWYGRL